MKLKIYLLCLEVFFFCTFSFQAFPQTFTEVANSIGIDLGGNKDGGHAWADFNNDGCLDLLANTDNNTNRSRLYLSNCDSDPDNITFSDITATHAAGLLSVTTERSIVWGDFNNDGYIDFARNTTRRIEVFINKGPSASPAYSFGDASQNPNYTFTDADITGMNSEGLLWTDINGDGFLDLVFDNHGNGTEVLYKDVNGSDPCTDGFAAYSDGSAIGLINNTSKGDYIAQGDLNNDGWPDFIVRKDDAAEDLYINDGDGTFTLNTNINDANAANGNKGGVAFCDFDNDGDFDVIWTDNDGNNIWENTGGDPINFTKHDESSLFGTSITTTIDGCACGDIDNDGDIDLLLTGNNARYLFRNDGAMNFTLNNGGISSSEDGESISMVDYDHDGDLDVYSNNDNDNELWRSDLNNDNYLKVRVVMQNQNSTEILGRDLIGTTATLTKTSDNSSVGGIQMINGGRGHGSQDPMIMHFGLPEGPDTTYTITVNFPSIAGSRLIETFTIVPSALDNQTLVVKRSAEELGMDINCNDLIFLPVELANFNAQKNNESIHVSWQTSSEKNTSHFELEKSVDGKFFTKIATINAVGNSDRLIDYNFLDRYVYATNNYYRLRIVDFDGQFEYSNVIYSKMHQNTTALEINAYPNPSFGELYLWCKSSNEKVFVEVFDQSGKLMLGNTYDLSNTQKVKLFDSLATGIYIIKVNDGIESKSIKVTMN